MIYSITKEDLKAIKIADRVTVRMAKGYTQLEFQVPMTNRIVGEFTISFEPSSRNHSLGCFNMHSNTVKVMLAVLKAGDNIDFLIEPMHSQMTREAGVVPYELIMRVCRYYGKNQSKHTTFNIILDSCVERGYSADFANVQQTYNGSKPEELINKSTTAA